MDIPGMPGGEDGASMKEQLQAYVGTSDTTRTDGSCDECGTDRGSMIHSREEDYTLCRDCWNDAEVLEKYV